MLTENSVYTISKLDIASQANLLPLLQHFSDTPWTMLLDSAEANHPDGRFSIFVADPVATVTLENNQTVVWQRHNSQALKTNERPADAIRDQLKQHGMQLPPEQASPLPFIVGAMGMFGYDLGRLYETLPNIAKQDYSTVDLAVGIYTWSVIHDSHTGEVFFCRHRDAGSPDAVQIIEWLSETCSYDSRFDLTSAWQSNMSRDEYTGKISRIHEYLRAGDCYQVNLAQRFTATYTGDELAAYRLLRKANSAPFSAFIRLPEQAVLSISPERFLSVNDGIVQSKPIKGTRPRSDDPVLDTQLKHRLQQSEKDRAENLMIVDLLRNDLSRTCEANSVDVPFLFEIESFSAVHHLVSTVTGKLQSSHDPLSLLEHAFPGGSITGAPKIRAMEIIDELEPHRRNIYCGSIGYVGIHNDMDTSICIRTLLCEDNKIHCWAGGGIVINSTAEDEYQESFDKVSRILPVLERGTVNLD